ncbi:MAG TPA: gliding motility-associated C-terminal domain-containing protein, partial [Flavipsychrobacter sp.]
MEIMKLTAKIFLSGCLLLLSAIGYDANACHLAAADMYIEYAGQPVDVCNVTPDYTYRVTLVVYSSCECGSITGVNETVRFSSVNGGVANQPIVLATQVWDTVDQLCPDFSKINLCRVPGNTQYPAYKRKIYSGTVTLPSAQTDWVFSWSSNARNQSLNLVGQGNLYIEAGMNNLDMFNNSTPRFESNPLPYICAGQTYNYLNQPYDPDPWDSNKVLVQTTIPLTAANTPKAYATGYSPANPVNGYSLNSATGTATFFPALQGKYTLSFRASDKYSYVLRDVQFAVLPCITTPPKIDSLPRNLENATLVGVKRADGTQRVDSIVYVCPGSELQFNINGWTDAPDNKLYMRADLARFNGAAFNTSGDGTDKVTGTFKWTPTTADYGPITLRVTVVDSTCNIDQPIVLPSFSEIQIMVVAGIDAGPDQPICELNPQPIQLFVKGTENLRLQWSIVDGGPVIGFHDAKIHNPLIEYPFVAGNDTILYPKTTGYIISTVDLAGQCKNRDTVYVYLDTSNMVTITPKNPGNPEDALVMCRPGYLQLEALIVGKRPMSNVSCGISAVPTVCDMGGNKPDSVDLYGSLVFGEAYYDTVDFQSPAMYPIMYTHSPTAKKQYLITKDELWASGLRSASIRKMAIEMTGYQGTDHTYKNLTISFKCTDKTSLSAEEGFENFGMSVAYSAPSVTLNDGWHEFDFGITPYNWDTTKNLIVQICYSNSDVLPCNAANPVPVMKHAPTAYISGLNYVPANSATQSVCNTGKDPGIIAARIRPVFKFKYCEADPLPFDIRWKEGELLSDSTIAQPLSYAAKSGRYIVQTIGRSTCIMRDTMELYIPEHDMRIQPEDTSLCLGDKAPFVIFGGHYFKWYEYENDQFITPGSVDEPTKGYTFIGPKRTTEYRVVVSDSVWCYDTLAMRIKILPLPDVRILNEDDTVVKYGQSFQLLASGARMYNWSPVSSLNNPNISYPIARPTEDTKYIVGGLAANGCRAFDTLHVIVDKRDNLFVPSAFSPNGDGKNDIFKVTNLSFQRIMEFRVFNRWGQEVFNTND